MKTKIWTVQASGSHPVSESKSLRLGIVTSHPIQYQAPLFRELAKLPGLDLEVLFLSTQGATRFHDPEFGLELSWDIDLLGGYRYSFLRNLAGSWNGFPFLSRINPGIFMPILRGRYDVILVLGWGVLTYWFCRIASALSFRCPILVMGDTNGMAPRRAGFRGHLNRLAQNWFFSGVSGFICIGTLNRQFYRSRQISDDRLFFAPYAVDNEYFNARAKEMAAEGRNPRAEIGLSNDSPVILFAGKLVRKKRPLDLIHALALVRKKIPVQLVVVGDGALMPEIRQAITEFEVPSVHMAGFKNQSEIGLYYAASDVLVVPSDFEPWGLVVNEAMCFGLAIIATDQVGSAFDLIQQNVNGRIYPSGDIEALAESILHVVSEPSRLASMQAASRRIIRNWNIAAQAEGIVSAAKAVVGRKHPEGLK